LESLQITNPLKAQEFQTEIARQQKLDEINNTPAKFFADADTFYNNYEAELSKNDGILSQKVLELNTKYDIQ
jgi:hypothetical protein